MRYTVQDTARGFRFIAESDGGEELHNVEMAGSHNPAAEAYGILERVRIGEDGLDALRRLADA